MQPWQREMYSPPRRRPVSPRRRSPGSVQRGADAWAFGSSTSRDTETWLRHGHVSATQTGLRPQQEKHPLGRSAQATSAQPLAQCSRCRGHTELEEGDGDMVTRSHSRLCRGCQAQIGAWTNAWADRRGDGRRGQRTPSPPRRGAHSPPRELRSPPRRTGSEPDAGRVGFGSSAPRTTHIGTATSIESTAQGLTVSPGAAAPRYKASGVNVRELDGWQSPSYAARPRGYEGLVYVLRRRDLYPSSQPVHGDTASTDEEQDGWTATLDDMDFDESVTERSRQHHWQPVVIPSANADRCLSSPCSPQVEALAAVDSQQSCDIQRVIERGLEETARARVALARFSMQNAPSQNVDQPRLSQRSESLSVVPTPAAQAAQQVGAMASTEESKKEMARLLTEAIAERRAAEERILSLQEALGLNGNVATQGAK